GVDAWSVRLPAAVAALGGAVLLCVLGYLRGRPLAGCFAACIQATALHYTWLARIGRIDMPLALAIGTCLGAFYIACRTGVESEKARTWSFLVLAYVAAALAILLKGPIGVVLPVVVVLVFLAAEKQLPAPWRLRAWLELANRFGVWWGVPLLL